MLNFPMAPLGLLERQGRARAGRMVGDTLKLGFKNRPFSIKKGRFHRPPKTSKLLLSCKPRSGIGQTGESREALGELSGLGPGKLRETPVKSWGYL